MTKQLSIDLESPFLSDELLALGTPVEHLVRSSVPLAETPFLQGLAEDFSNPHLTEEQYAADEYSHEDPEARSVGSDGERTDVEHDFFSAGSPIDPDLSRVVGAYDDREDEKGEETKEGDDAHESSGWLAEEEAATHEECEEESLVDDELLLESEASSLDAADTLDAAAAQTPFSRAVKARIEPLLGSTQVAAARNWNTARHPAESGIEIATLRARLDQYLDGDRGPPPEAGPPIRASSNYRGLWSPSVRSKNNLLAFRQVFPGCVHRRTLVESA